ncbi:MAG: hypothetical protein QM778_37795 [Myxococcales bacterium]
MMQPTRPAAERRRQRSDDAHTALSLQLAQVKHAASLDAVVLATAEGLLIAHAGDDELCSELAAVAPILSSEGAMPANSNLGHGMLHVQAVSWDGSPIYLAGTHANVDAKRDAEAARWIEQAQAGVTRILAA